MELLMVYDLNFKAFQMVLKKSHQELSNELKLMYSNV